MVVMTVTEYRSDPGKSHCTSSVLLPSFPSYPSDLAFLMISISNFFRMTWASCFHSSYHSMLKRSGREVFFIYKVFFYIYYVLFRTNKTLWD